MNTSFTTRDLYLASYLYAKNVKLIRLDRNGKECWFVFANKAKSEKLEQNYYAKTGMVTGKAFTDAIKTLKHLVFTNEKM